MNWDFSTLTDWFVDNKLNVYFGEEKTKLILFSQRHKSNSVGQVDISYKDVKIKQYSKVTYLGCVLDEYLTGESIAIQVWKNWFLLKGLRRLLCNFCANWYPNLDKTYKNKLQVLKNKSSVHVFAYNWTTESTLNILTRLRGFQ